MRTRIILLFWVVLGVAAEALKETVHREDLNSDHERRNIDAALPSYLEARIKRQQDLNDVKLSSQENVRVNAHDAPVFVLDADENGAKKVVKKDTDSVKTKLTVQDLTKRNQQLENDNATLAKQVADLTDENQALREDKVALEAEIYRLKVANTELAENANLERENKNLLDQLREANNAFNDANRRLNELIAANATLTADRDYLAAALSDTEDSLKDAENKLANANSALAVLKSEMEQRLLEKDQETHSVRMSGQHAMEELQRTIVEVEIRYKSEIAHIKKKYESDIWELETTLDNANGASAEYFKQVKVLQQRNKELEVALVDAQRQLDDTRVALTISERKRIALANELDDALQESAECARKNAENEPADMYFRLTEVTPQVTALTNDKRRMKADIAVMQSDLDEAVNGKIAAEERADRLQAEVHRLAEELREEKENYKDAESLRKQLEVEIRKITIRLEDAETFSMRAGKRQLAKFQARIHDLEAEYEFEQRRAREAMVNARKQERQYKELLAVIENDTRQIADLTSLTDSLNSKIKTYRRQIDEAEEVANIAMNKYRKASVLIEEVEHRADIVERNLQALRRPRSMSESRELTKVVRI